jgi:hypothetical protein
MAGVREVIDNLVRGLHDDLDDAYLPSLLLLAVLTCGFGIWFRVPNFAGPDEYSRLVQPMKIAGGVAAECAYVTYPRDDATDWVATNAPEDATIEVYENSVVDVGVPHGANVSHYLPRERGDEHLLTCPQRDDLHRVDAGHA